MANLKPGMVGPQMGAVPQAQPQAGAQPKQPPPMTPPPQGMQPFQPMASPSPTQLINPAQTPNMGGGSVMAMIQKILGGR